MPGKAEGMPVLSGRREAALTVLERAATLLHPPPPKGSLQEEKEENVLQLLCFGGPGKHLATSGKGRSYTPTPPSKHHPVLSA